MAAVFPLLPTAPHPLWLSARRVAFADKVFSGKIEIHPVLVKETLYRLPFSLIPQIAFVGRSNVGKSSLINALLHGREVTRPSPLAGRTRQLFTFDINNTISLVDLPGYGFAGKATKPERESWIEMMKEYLSKANGVEIIVSLLDARQGVKQIDEEFWQIIKDCPIHPKRETKPYILVCLTKADLVDSQSLQNIARSTVSRIEHFRKNEDMKVWPYLHAVSAESGLGLKELRSTVTSMCPMDQSANSDKNS